MSNPGGTQQYSAHARAKELFNFDLANHTIEGDLDQYDGADLLTEMLDDLRPVDADRRYPSVSWSDLATRANFRLTHDSSSGWYGLSRLQSTADATTRTDWFINPDNRVTPFISSQVRPHTDSDFMANCITVAFWLSGGGSQEVGVEVALMHGGDGERMDQAQFNELTTILDQAFVDKLK